MIAVDRINSKFTKGHFVIMDRTDAVRLIETLAHQLDANSPNSGRTEFKTVKGEYFSVAVVNKDYFERNEK